MNLKIKETLAMILTRLNPSVLTTTWSGVGPTMSAAKVLSSMTLKSNSKYLIIAYNGNGIAAGAACNVNFACAGASKLLLGPGYTNDGSGNPCTGWAYVETGSSDRTFQINSYGYNSAAHFTGSAVAIPIMGGYCLIAFSRLSAIVRRWRHELESKGDAGQSGTGANRSAEADDSVQAVISGSDQQLDMDSTIHGSAVYYIYIEHKDILRHIVERSQYWRLLRRWKQSGDECFRGTRVGIKRQRDICRQFIEQLLSVRHEDVFYCLRFSELTTSRLGVVA